MLIIFSSLFIWISVKISVSKFCPPILFAEFVLKFLRFTLRCIHFCFYIYFCVYLEYFPIKNSIQINILIHTYMISICFLLFILIIKTELDSHIQKCFIHSEESITCHCDSTLFEIKLFRLEAIIYPIYNFFLFFICSLFTNITHFFP